MAAAELLLLQRQQMTVVGTLDSGRVGYDSALALVHEQDAARIFRLEG